MPKTLAKLELRIRIEGAESVLAWIDEVQSELDGAVEGARQNDLRATYTRLSAIQSLISRLRELALEVRGPSTFN